MADLAQDWAAIVEALDRHQLRGRSSADRAGLPELMRQYDLPGLSIAVEEAGVGQWATGFGTTAADSPHPVTPRTVFQACSISKHVAAFGVLRLVDAGVVDLDEDIAAYLTSWRLPACDGWTAVVTVRQLLAHTAGLSYNWFRGFRAGQQLPTMSQVLAGQPPATSPPVRVSMLPGSRFRYSGSHYAVLQQLVEDVTDEPFTRLMRTLVFDPVGMTDSDYDQDFPSGRTDPVAVGHHVDGTPVAGRWRTQPELAGAGLWTTPADLTRLGREITRAVAGRSALLSRQLADQMVTPQVPDGFGLGTQVDGRRFGHTGGNVGYGCWSYTWPEATVSVMANSEGSGEILDSLFLAAENRYGREPAPITQVTGVYRLRDDYLLSIQAIDGGLTLTAPGQQPIALRPLPDGGFEAPGLDCELSFHRTDDGRQVLRLSQERGYQEVGLVDDLPA